MNKIRYLNNYRVIYKPSYENSMTSGNWVGYVYEHIYVVEIYLKRKLCNNEVVHHLDGNIRNNRIENLLVLERGQHLKLHTWLNCKTHKQPTYCEKCGITLQRKEKRYCSKECEPSKSKVKPSKDILIDNIEKYNWCEIGRKYGVSDNAVRKWARGYGLL